MKNSIILLFSLLVLLACKKESEPVLPDLGTAVNFAALEIGQSSTFKQYSSHCGDIDGSFTYTGNSLVLTVISIEGNLHLEERNIFEGNPMDTVTYPVTVRDNLVMIPERLNSNLFYFYGSDTLRLRPTEKRTLQQDGCYLLMDEVPFEGNDIGQIDHFKVGPIEQHSKTVVSCVPPFIEDAYLVYDERQLFMSHALWSGISGYSVTGYVLEE